MTYNVITINVNSFYPLLNAVPDSAESQIPKVCKGLLIMNKGGRIIDNQHIDNLQIDNPQIDNLTNFRQIDNLQINNLEMGIMVLLSLSWVVG